MKYAVALVCLVALVPAFRAASVKSDAGTAAKEVRFYLYTSPHDKDVGRQIRASDPSSFAGIDTSHPLIILIHGFLQNYQCGFPQDVKDAYLIRSDHPAVIAVDWSDYTCTGMSAALSPLCYPSAVSDVQTAGLRISELMSAMINNGRTSASNIHIVGVSLGAHAAGRAGNEFTKATGQKIARITGLDPAGPSFNGGLGGSRALQKGDAVFVDAIHTDSGSLGTTKNNGDADYWPNGGKNPQPGCEGAPNTECSHGTAARLFMQTINSGGLIGYACQSYDAFTTGTCNRESTAQATMGHHTEKHAAGAFFLQTTPAQGWSGRYSCY